MSGFLRLIFGTRLKEIPPNVTSSIPSHNQKDEDKEELPEEEMTRVEIKEQVNVLPSVEDDFLSNLSATSSKRNLFAKAEGYKHEWNIRNACHGFNDQYQHKILKLMDSKSKALFEIILEKEKNQLKSSEKALLGIKKSVAIPANHLAVRGGGPEFKLRIIDPSSREDIRDGSKMKSKKDNALKILGNTSVPPNTTFTEEINVEDCENLTTKDAYAFVEKSLGMRNAGEIEKLCETLDNISLAVKLAVAYIQIQNCSFRRERYGIMDYLKDYEDKIGSNAISNKMERAVLTTLKITVAKISKGSKGPAALQILRCLSYLHPEGISIQFLKELVQPLERILGNDVFEKCLDLLKSYSLVKIGEGKVVMDKLLRKMVQFQCMYSREDKKMLGILSINCEIAVEEDYLKYDKVKQILAVWETIKKDDQLAIQFKTIPSSLGYRLDELGMYAQFQQFSKEAVERFSHLLPEIDEYFLDMESLFGFANFRIGSLQKSLEILTNTFKKQKEVLGKEAELTLITTNSLACVLSALRRFDDAESLYESILTTQIKFSGGEVNEAISTSKFNLGGVFLNKGDVSKALGIFEEVLDWQRVNLAEDHPTTLETKHLVLSLKAKQKGSKVSNEPSTVPPTK